MATSANTAMVLEWGDKGAPKRIAEGLSAAGWRVIKGDRGSPKWKGEVIRQISGSDQPHWLIMPQRLYGQDKPVEDALKRSSTKLLVVDFGLIDHYANSIFDRTGGNGNSSVANGGLDILISNDRQREEAMKYDKQLSDWRDSMRISASKFNPSDALIRAKEKGFAVFFGQRKGDMVLWYDADMHYRSPIDAARRFMKDCIRIGVVPVIKSHPMDDSIVKDPMLIDHSTMVPRGRNDGLSAWLILNAKFVVMVNSTVVFNALALHATVAQYGKGWASGNGIVNDWSENSMDLSVRNNDRADMFIRLLLSRQRSEASLSDPVTITGLLSFFDAVEGPEPVKRTDTLPPLCVAGAIPIITCVHIPVNGYQGDAEHTMDLVKKSMSSLPDSHIVCIDNAPDAFVQWCTDGGHTIEQMYEGKPPRMSRLLGQAVSKLSADTGIVWVLEQDAELSPESKTAAERMLINAPDKVAGIELRSVDENGTTNFPCSARTWSQATRKGDILILPHCCWSASVWRVKALKTVDFSKLPALNKSDIVAGAVLRSKGYILWGAWNITYIHRPHSSYEKR